MAEAERPKIENLRAEIHKGLKRVCNGVGSGRRSAS